MADQLVYDLSSQTENFPTIFLKRDWLSILDNQNGQYSGNQCVIDTSQLSNSNRFMSYREAYLQIPMVMTLTGDANNLAFAPATAATSCDYACGLKNWFGSVIHSIQVDWNGVTVIQQTNFQGLYNTFRLMTSLSVNDVLTQGAAMGFYPDDALSVIFTAAASPNGIGTCFTQNSTPSTVVTGTYNSYVNGNIGMIKRQQYINFNPDGATAPGSALWSTLLSAANSAQIYKSHIFSKTNDGAAARGEVQWAINGQVKLRHLHHMFEKIPLLKGTFLKITMQLNNSVVSFASSAIGANLSVTNVQVASGGVSPLQIASAAGAVAAAYVPGCGSLAAFPVGAYTLSLAVGATVLTTQTSVVGVTSSPMSRNITLNVPSYVFAPAYEMAYIGSPIKKIVYEDIYQYQVLNVASAGLFNNLITNGLANITKVLVLPYFTATANGGISPLTSPFDGAGCGVTSPLCLLSQFQVVVSGANSLYNTQRYAYQEFMEQLSGCNAINGDETDGLTSGLIGQLDFETAYNYYFVNVARCLDVEKAVPKSVSIQGQNMSGKAIDLVIFLAYEQTISVDVLSGSRV
jgi:hypothetical protein